MGILCVYLIGVHLPSVRLTGVVSVHLTGVVSVHLSHKLASYRRTSHSPYRRASHRRARRARRAFHRRHRRAEIRRAGRSRDRRPTFFYVFTTYSISTNYFLMPIAGVCLGEFCANFTAKANKFGVVGAKLRLL
jgi:hypothetical protein